MIRPPFEVSDVVVSAATADERALGVVGNVGLTIDGRLRIDALACVQRESGEVVLGYRRQFMDSGGSLPIVAPLDDETHRIFEDAVADEAARVLGVELVLVRREPRQAPTPDSHGVKPQRFALSDIAIRHPSPNELAAGMIGLIALTFDGRLRIDAFALARVDDGRYTIDYRYQQNADGTLAPIVRALDASTYRGIVEAIMAEVSRRSAGVVEWQVDLRDAGGAS